MLEIAREYLQSLPDKASVTTGLQALVIIIMAWLGIRLVSMTLDRFERRLVNDDPDGEGAKRTQTLIKLMRQGALVLISTVAGLMVLSALGVDIGPILASAGIVGLAVGFGAQNLVRDVISGFFIVFENQVRVGDVALVNGTGGQVEQLNLRTIVLRDLSGVVHVFPNGAITTLANMTKEWSAYVMEIGVAYKENTDRVVEVMQGVGAELRQDEHFGPLIIEDLEVFGVDKFADSAVVIKARLKTRPIKQWMVGREYLRRLKHAFDAQGIEIPFPHRSIYFGEASKPILASLVDGADAPHGAGDSTETGSGGER